MVSNSLIKLMFGHSSFSVTSKDFSFLSDSFSYQSITNSQSRNSLIFKGYKKTHVSAVIYYSLKLCDI